MSWNVYIIAVVQCKWFHAVATSTTYKINKSESAT